MYPISVDWTDCIIPCCFIHFARICRVIQSVKPLQGLQAQPQLAALKKR